MQNKKYIKYPKIPFLTEIPNILEGNVKVFEKLDGGNTSIRKINYQIFCGTRGHYINEKNLGRSYWAKDFLHWVMANKSFYNIPEDIIIYGEWLAKHTLQYHKQYENKFFLLDILDLKSNKFFDYEESKNLVKNYELKDIYILQTLLEGKVCIEEIKKIIKKSNYRDGYMEGVVIKDYKSQKFAKLWTKTLLEDKNDFLSFVMQQAFFSLLETGKNISKEDILEEMIKNIKAQNKNFDFKSLEEFVNKNYTLYMK